MRDAITELLTILASAIVTKPPTKCVHAYDEPWAKRVWRTCTRCGESHIDFEDPIESIAEHTNPNETPLD